MRVKLAGYFASFLHVYYNMKVLFITLFVLAVGYSKPQKKLVDSLRPDLCAFRDDTQELHRLIDTCYDLKDESIIAEIEQSTLNEEEIGEDQRDGDGSGDALLSNEEIENNSEKEPEGELREESANEPEGESNEESADESEGGQEESPDESEGDSQDESADESEGEQEESPDESCLLYTSPSPRDS